MAKSYITFNNEGIWLDDFQIETWLYLMSEEIDGTKLTEEWLTKLSEHWRMQATFGFLGSVSPDFELFINSTQRKSILLRIAKTFEQKVNAKTIDLTAKTLKMKGIGGYSFTFLEDFQHSQLLEIHTRIIDLIIRKK